MSRKASIRIGGSAEEIGAAFVEAWHRAEAGDLTAEQPVVTFESLATFNATFSDARRELLDTLAEGPASSIMALAGTVGRPYRRVHDDVAALIRAGAIRRSGRRLALAMSGATVTLTFGRATPR